MSPLELNLVLWPLLGTALALSVVTDLRHRRIYDWVTLPVALIAVTLRLGYLGPVDALGALGAALAVSALPAYLAWRGSMGWGDVKLLLAVGCVFGWPLSITAAAMMSAFSVLAAVAAHSFRGKRAWVPLAVPMAAGCVSTMAWAVVT